MRETDLISRQAAYDTLSEYYHHRTDAQHDALRDALNRVPSAQPEQPFEIQEILDYLDTELHPIISPEHWNMYSELHDMISTLPSAQPRNGEWIYNESDGVFECSVCGGQMIRNVFAYCPWCGARISEAKG